MILQRIALFAVETETLPRGLTNSRIFHHHFRYAGETLGWMPIKAHHWPGEGKISFIRGESAQVMEAETLHA